MHECPVGDSPDTLRQHDVALDTFNSVWCQHYVLADPSGS